MAPRPLRLVSAPAAVPAANDGSPGDVALLCLILAVALLPVGGAVAGAPFGPGEAGAGTATALLAGRELLAALRARLLP